MPYCCKTELQFLWTLPKDRPNTEYGNLPGFTVRGRGTVCTSLIELICIELLLASNLFHGLLNSVGLISYRLYGTLNFSAVGCICEERTTTLRREIGAKQGIAGD